MYQMPMYTSFRGSLTNSLAPVWNFWCQHPGLLAARCGDGHDRVVGMRLALRGTRLAPVLGSGGEGRSINLAGSNGFLRRGCHRAECSGRSGWPAARSPPARRQALHTAAVGVNGVELHCVRAGEAGPAVLCMPGALGTAMTDFEPRLAGLSQPVTACHSLSQPATACHSLPACRSCGRGGRWSRSTRVATASPGRQLLPPGC